MDDDVTAMLIALEQRCLDLIVNRMNLVDVEIAWHRKVEVDMTACSGAPASKPMQVDPWRSSRRFEQGSRGLDERFVGLIHQPGQRIV